MIPEEEKREVEDDAVKMLGTRCKHLVCLVWGVGKKFNGTGIRDDAFAVGTLHWISQSYARAMDQIVTRIQIYFLSFESLRVLRT